jgi:hypothetical protein
MLQKSWAPKPFTLTFWIAFIAGERTASGCIREFRWILTRLKPDDQLLAQFTVGKHVDHVLTRRAAELLGRPLHYVADIPYLFNHPEDLDPNRAGMKETAHAVSETGVKLWQDAIEAYSSQMSMLFKSPQAMRSQISEYANQNGGVRLWTP